MIASTVLDGLNISTCRSICKQVVFPGLRIGSMLEQQCARSFDGVEKLVLIVRVIVERQRRTGLFQSAAIARYDDRTGRQGFQRNRAERLLPERGTKTQAARPISFAVSGRSKGPTSSILDHRPSRTPCSMIATADPEPTMRSVARPRISLTRDHLSQSHKMPFSGSTRPTNRACFRA